MSFYQFTRTQKINANINEVWDFIASPQNLKEITPDSMGFDITTGKLPSKMYAGMVIGYKVSPLFGIKMNWLTQISHVKEKEFFVDEQLVGPYKLWHHEHHIYPIMNGVLMKDVITYQPPFGILGRIANSLLIKKQLNKIFNYRKQKLENIFGAYNANSGNVMLHTG